MTARPARGAVALVGFVFSDESGAKLRPVIVVSTTAYHRDRQEAIVVAVTSNLERRPLVGDHLIDDWKQAGLLFPSVASGIVRTVKRRMIERVIGRLSRDDLAGVETGLRRALGL